MRRRLSLGDIDELACRQRQILNRSVLIDQLLDRAKLQGKSDEAPEGSIEG